MISNAVSCSSIVAATSCQPGYYLSSGYCNSCLLNCLACSSPYDCSNCAAGYYLNASILTCNPCPTGCKTCNQYTPSVCTACNNGYQLLNQNCQQVACAIDQCIYCSTPGVCQNCASFYYWNGNACVSGSSVTCENGATGPLPNNCANQCSGFAYVVGSGTFACKAYSSVYVYPIEYHQYYYYAYNQNAELNALSGTNQALNL